MLLLSKQTKRFACGKIFHFIANTDKELMKLLYEFFQKHFNWRLQNLYIQKIQLKESFYLDLFNYS